MISPSPEMLTFFATISIEVPSDTTANDVRYLLINNAMKLNEHIILTFHIEMDLLYKYLPKI